MFSYRKGNAIKVEIGDDGIRSVTIQSEEKDLDYVFNYFKKVVECLSSSEKCKDEDMYR